MLGKLFEESTRYFLKNRKEIEIKTYKQLKAEPELIMKKVKKKLQQNSGFGLYMVRFSIVRWKEGREK